MSNNINSSDSWYAPLRDEGPAAATKEKKKKTWRVIGIIALVVLLIVGSSLAFSGGSEEPAVQEQEPELYSPDEEMPDNWEDFFDTYFTDVQTDTAEIGIPIVKADAGFSLKLKPAGKTELSLKEIYAACSPSIVAISAYADGMAGYSWGTGIILSADGLILTNTHVIDGADSATVTLYDDSAFEARLIGADSISDVALLKIEATGLPAAEFGESSDLSVGDKVAAIGNPLGETFRMTLTDGIISAIERGISYNGHSMTLLQTNTALNEGNSGGALFNMYGQVIGITNMKMMSAYSSIEGIGFAIPSATVASVVDSLIEYGEVRGRPSIGITVGAIPENASVEYELPYGLYVSAVSENSDAAAQGIQVGDIVLAVNGTTVTTTDEVLAIKNSLKVGDSMTLTIWREGESFDVSIKLVDTNDVY